MAANSALSVAPGNMLAMDGITRWLELNGFVRASTVREPGDYAVRGGILDLFAPGMDLPVRLDFFGDTLETIRSFDPETQRTVFDMRGLDLVPVSEFQLMTETIRKFRTGYVATFGAAAAAAGGIHEFPFLAFPTSPRFHNSQRFSAVCRVNSRHPSGCRTRF